MIFGVVGRKVIETFGCQFVKNMIFYENNFTKRGTKWLIKLKKMNAVVAVFAQVIVQWMLFPKKTVNTGSIRIIARIAVHASTVAP
jgi:hypothetical protein